jgi:pentatricopeptide repeat protein
MAKEIQPLPRDAQKLIRDFERAARAVWEKAAAEIAARRKQLVKSLKSVQDAHVRAGRIDDALAVRDQMRHLETAMTTGQPVEVEWEGEWWKAEVRDVRGSRYYVHYVGWEDEWDEWVGRDRVRFPGVRKRTRRNRRLRAS